MPHWIQLCHFDQAPAEGEVLETEVNGVAICLARHEGTLSALDNWCPHRQGPLGQGWLEGGAVICPWHSWAFDLQSGLANPPDHARVHVFPLRIEAGLVLIEMEQVSPAESR